jgi:hypothetical protein
MAMREARNGETQWSVLGMEGSGHQKNSTQSTKHACMISAVV